jgi:hypothetical protein
MLSVSRVTMVLLLVIKEEEWSMSMMTLSIPGGMP